MAPKPLGWGRFNVESPETYFLIGDFKDMGLGLPDPLKLARRAVQLHGNTSPNGMFGFDVTTFNGKVSHVTDWEPSWTKFFTRLLSNTLSIDEGVNGRWPELAAVAEQMLSAVCPRLLDNLQVGSEPITPKAYLSTQTFGRETRALTRRLGILSFMAAGLILPIMKWSWACGAVMHRNIWASDICDQTEP